MPTGKKHEGGDKPSEHVPRPRDEGHGGGHGGDRGESAERHHKESGPLAEAELTVKEAPKPVEVEEVKDEGKLVMVTPRRTIMNVRIGNDYYSFSKGVRLKVPQGIVDHLREKGVVG